MLSPEEYGIIVKAVSEETPLTQEQANGLVKTIQQMDVQLLIGQNALQLAMENLAVAVPAIGQKVMERCGRTDKKVKHAVAEMSADLVGSCEESIQSYMIGAMLEAAQMLDVSLDELLGTEHIEEEAPAEEAAE